MDIIVSKLTTTIHHILIELIKQYIYAFLSCLKHATPFKSQWMAKGPQRIPWSSPSSQDPFLEVIVKFYHSNENPNWLVNEIWFHELLLFIFAIHEKKKCIDPTF
jgi:hypothetical protein